MNERLGSAGPRIKAASGHGAWGVGIKARLARNIGFRGTHPLVAYPPRPLSAFNLRRTSREAPPREIRHLEAMPRNPQPCCLEDLSSVEPPGALTGVTSSARRRQGQNPRLSPRCRRLREKRPRERGPLGVHRAERMMSNGLGEIYEEIILYDLDTAGL